MARREEQRARVLERGELQFYYRPRVERRQVEDISDVQRLLIVLCPSGQRRYRVIALGRKRMPKPGERFWGFVDLVLDSDQDLRAALGASTYVTRTRGVRSLPAAQRIKTLRYELVSHDGHAHLDYGDGSCIITVANPDPAAWGLLETPPLQLELFDETEVHVTVPATLPRDLQSRFGEKRFIPLDSARLLDHPGVELVFIGSPAPASALLEDLAAAASQ